MIRTLPSHVDCSIADSDLFYFLLATELPTPMEMDGRGDPANNGGALRRGRALSYSQEDAVGTEGIGIQGFFLLTAFPIQS